MDFFKGSNTGINVTFFSGYTLMANFQIYLLPQTAQSDTENVLNQALEATVWRLR
jgi:hypothetical protein